MALTIGALKVLFYLQKVNLVPFQVELDKHNKLRATSEPFTKSKHAKWAWHAIQSLVIFEIFLYILKLGMLRKTWLKTKDLEQFGILLALLCILIIILGTYLWLKLKQDTICQTLTDLFKLVSAKPKKFTWKNMSPLEALVYSDSFVTFLAYPAIFAFAPLVRDYEAGEWFLALVFTKNPSSPSLPIKLAVSGFYFILAIPVISTILTIIMLMMTVGESTLVLSFRLGNGKNSGESFVEFRNFLKTYRHLQMLLNSFNECACVYNGFFAGMCQIISACCAYFTLLMYNYIPIVMYLACVGVVLAVVFMTFVLITLGGIPHDNVEKRKVHWKSVYGLRSKRQRMELKSCPPIGYSIVVINVVKKQTALSIWDVNANFTATLVLMSDFKRISG